MSPTGKAVAQAGGDRFRKAESYHGPKALGDDTALAIVFSFWSPAGAADTSTSAPQIQGDHLRIEFDRYLHSRVVARFDGHETTMGPFVASETRDNRGQKMERVFAGLTKERAG